MANTERNPTPPSWTLSSDEEAGNEDGDDETDTPAEPEEPKPLGVTVAITGGSVYVRVATARITASSPRSRRA